MADIQPLTPDMADAVEALLDRAFGPERRERTAYKVRGHARSIAALGFLAVDGGELVGSIQCWPVALRLDAGGTSSLVMVGPVAVAPERRREGVGRRLTEAALEAAAAQRLNRALCLIGDPEYYGRFFGFTSTRTGGWRLPGPVERRRLLALGPDVPAEAGVLGPKMTADA